MERQFLTPYSFAVYTCRVYGQVLDVARTTYMAAPDWFTVERQDFVVLRRGRIWRPKQNAWLNGKNSLHVTYKQFRSWILWMGLCFSEMTLFCRLLLLIHRAWSCLWHLLSKESLRVSHSRESRGEKYELKLLNFYPKKPHKWRRFSIYTSSMMIFTPHQRLMGQDICQTGGVLMLKDCIHCTVNSSSFRSTAYGFLPISIVLAYLTE